MTKRWPKEDDDVRATKRSKSTTAGSDDGEPSINRYAGWTVPTKNYNLPTINIADVTPETFYTDYVKRRRPVVLGGGLPKDVLNVEQWKDVNYLERWVADEPVMVEKRRSATDSFGKGHEIRLLFKEFVQLIREGDDQHYLTTQDVRANAEGRPDLMSPLLQRLKADFPLRPALMGHLVPSNINIWMGNNKDGASSGLHHDYHDNLYIVLKGRKRFRLFSPGDAEKMYTRGELLTVHPNGRINYAGEETTAYGADVRSDAAAAAARQKEAAEHVLARAERAVAEGKPGAEEELARAEDELDTAMDAVLDAEMDDDDEDEEATGALVERYDGGDQRRLVDKTVANPNNFSTVESDVLDNKEKLSDSHPNFLHATAAFCDVAAGSMLYLPASWFHEVTSYSKAGGHHCALNYWFHPPDGNDFNSPYSTDFWRNDYRDRLGN